MHVAVRAVCVLALVLTQVALPALAQTDNTPIVVPAQPLPPEVLPPEKQTPAESATRKLPLPPDKVVPAKSATEEQPDTLPPEPELPHPAEAPSPPEAPPSAQQATSDYPLSMQVLQAHISYAWAGGNPLTITRGGIEAPNLMDAVAGSARAASLIQAGYSQAATGTALVISGLAIVAGTIIVSIPVLASNSNNPYNDQSGAVAGLLVGTLIGTILSTAGYAVQWGGYHQMLEGVNAYNADLLDGRLAPPATTAVPAR